MGKLGEALTELPDDDAVRALVVYNCNPAAIVPNQAKVLAGLARDDLFTVVLEQFVTDTARYADVVLPATTQIEHLDLMPSWGHLYLTLNLPAIEPLGEALPNTEVFRRLAAALGLDHPALQTSDEDLIRELLDATTHPFAEGITYERLVAEGSIRLQRPDDWRPHANGGFPTPSGKAELVRAVARGPRARRAAHLGPGRRGPPRRPCPPGSLPAVVPHVEAAPALPQLQLPEAPRPHRSRGRTAASRSAPPTRRRAASPTATACRVWNDRGAMELVATISDRVRPSLVSVPFGWPLEASGGVSCNTLTSDASTDLGGGTAFHDNLVEVARVG